jgi:hypothetical protein
MDEGDSTTTHDGVETLEREIVACDVRLSFLTASSPDDQRLTQIRAEVLERKREAERRLALLRGGAG